MVLDMDEWRTLGTRSGYWVVSAIECGGSGARAWGGEKVKNRQQNSKLRDYCPFCRVHSR